MLIKRPKGTQDIIPGTIEKWHFLEEQIRKICQEYGYQEIRTPVFEATELFQRGVGETTDIVNKEMYTFLDKGQRSITLRPEGTASICRAYVENKLYAQTLPVKLYYLGPMFRYENTQAGRYRQFHQFGIEVLGVENPLVDAEVIQLLWDFLQRLGLQGLEVHINSVGCSHCRAVHREKLQTFLEDRKDKLCSDCQSRLERNPLRILDCKNKNCQALTVEAPTTLDTLCPDCQEHWESVQHYLKMGDISFKINPKLVRGLDYYQKTAFEVMAKGIGAQSAICGGGRYDGLVEEIGGPSTPGIGFAVGLERILAAMQSQKIEIECTDKTSVMVAVLGDKARQVGFQLANQLRQRGIIAFMDLMGRSLKSQMKYADRVGSRYVLILGEEELEKGIIIVRDMKLGDQKEIAKADLIEFIQNIDSSEFEI
ncbi:MAG: histidine--tRNA ligase [Peptococcaceae bacterium]|nr:histidine--tRNA ligase [Peptococcaceae bacterium]